MAKGKKSFIKIFFRIIFILIFISILAVVGIGAFAYFKYGVNPVSLVSQVKELKKEVKQLKNKIKTYNNTHELLKKTIDRLRSDG